MATTVNYFPLDDRLNIYDSTYSRVDAQSYTTDWQALNATVRVTDDPVAIMEQISEPISSACLASRRSAAYLLPSRLSLSVRAG